MRFVPISSEIKAAQIDSVAEPVTIKAVVTLEDGSQQSVIVPASAQPGDFVKLNDDGSSPSEANLQDGSFLDKTTAARDYLKIS